MDAFEVAKSLGILPAVAIVGCYWHFNRTHRPTIVRVLALLDAICDFLGIKAEAREESEAEAERFVPPVTVTPELVQALLAQKLGEKK